MSADAWCILICIVSGIVLAVCIAVLALRAWRTKVAQLGLRDSMRGRACAECNDYNTSGYLFNDLFFVGVAPFAAWYKLNPALHPYCPPHAREQCWKSSFSTALKGYWGFPGIIGAPLSVLLNLNALRKARTLTLAIAAKVTVCCIVAPIAFIAALAFLIWRLAI